MKIEIWSDVVCPWCYIGKRRLERALADFDEDVEIEWRSFELDSRAPKTLDMPLDEALARKYRMSSQRAKEMLENMRQMAQDEGLEFHFDKAQTGNTFDAHRLIHLARSKGKGAEMKERLLQAYFTEGQPISDVETLVELAGEIGLDASAAREALTTDSFEANVRADEQEARQIGVTGVPFFLIDEKYGVSGAQMPETLLHVLKRAQQDRAAATPAAKTPSAQPPAADMCDDESCEVPQDATR